MVNRWVLIVLGVLVSIYGAYVAVQYTRLNELNQRELADAGAELKRAVENAIVNVTQRDSKSAEIGNANPGTDDVCDWTRELSYLSLELPLECEKTQFVTLAQNSSAARLTVDNDGVHIEAKSIKPRNDPATKKDARLRFRTDKLFEELSYLRSLALIAVTNDNGAVFFQTHPGDGAWSRYLRWGTEEFAPSTGHAAGSLRVQNLSELLGGAQGSGWKFLHSASSRTTLQMGGDLYQLYLQPISFENGASSTAENGMSAYVVLVAAAPVQGLVRQALGVDTYFYAGVVFLFSLGILGFPFVKLAVLDARERFRLHDVYRLYLSTGAVLMLFTCFVLGWDGYQRWRGVADAGLREMAAKLGDGVEDEVAAIDVKLSRYDLRTALVPGKCDSWKIDHDWYNEKRDKTGLPLLLNVPGAEVFVQQLAWIGPDGKQVWRVMTEKVGGKLQVGSRPYYLAARDGNLFWISDPLPLDERNDGFFLGPDRSISTGKLWTFVSKKSVLTGELCKQPDPGGYVAVALAQLMSLTRPALPAGYGFAMVSLDGQVLYHSDPHLSLRENLFSELGSADRAKALMYAGESDGLSTTYRERPHEFYFHRLRFGLAKDRTGSAGLYLAVFRDTAMEQAVVAHAFLTSQIALVLTFVPFMAMAMLAMFCLDKSSGQCRGSWLWPHGGLEPMYRKVTLALVAVFVVGFALSFSSFGDAAFLAMPIFAAVTGIWIYASEKPHKQPRSRLPDTVWHTGSLGMLLVCMVIAPASSTFRLVLNHEFAQMITTERNWIDQQEKDAPIALMAAARSEGYPELVGETMAGARKAHRLSASPFETGPRPLGSLSRWILKAHEWLDHALPIESDAVLRQRHQPGDAIYSPGGEFAASPVAILGFGIVLGALVWWIRWNTLRIFHAGREAHVSGLPMLTPDQLEKVWAGCTIEDRIALVQIAEEQVANPRQRETVEGLLARGLLTFAPALQPANDVLRDFILGKAQAHRAELIALESVDAGRSWQHARKLLLVAVAALALFLLAAQPGLQSSLLGIATGLTATLTAILKLWEQVARWFDKSKTA